MINTEINAENPKRTNVSKKKKFFFKLFSVCLAMFLFLVFAELFLRLAPIPGIQFNTAKFDKLVGSVCYPHSISSYRNARGDFVQRKVNSWGYLDKEHVKEKKQGVYRIGFFGDSFTEARQVHLENTFFRIIERKLKKHNVECLAFGISGFSSLQSYLNSKRWSNFFNLDLIVYVFCENDLSDSIREIRRDPNRPYAVLTENGFYIDYSFREKTRYKQKIYFKIADYLTAHSLVVTTLVQRIRLLTKHGIKVKVSEEDRLMATKSKFKSKPNIIPNQGDLPSTWPDFWREYAKKLGSAIISKWRDEVNEQKRKFVILYIPRFSEIEKKTKEQDSWKYWLESICEERNINFIDPTEKLLVKKLQGKEIIYDHFTKEGHKAFAGAFVKWFKENLPRN